MVSLFPESVLLENLFTEAVARLFETRPDVCFAWLKEAGMLSPGHAAGTVRVRSQLDFSHSGSRER